MFDAQLIPVEVIRAAAARPEVIRAVAEVYADLDRHIAALNPVCRNSGRCCRFGAFGHRLFVTTLEAAYFLAHHPHGPSPTEDACPWAIGGVCTARDARPVGCRIFFCDQAAQSWQGPLTEGVLTRLRQLHEHLSVEYFYADWLAILTALGPAPVRHGG